MLDDGAFEDGFGIDGSSIRGWAAINESDMLNHSRSCDRLFSIRSMKRRTLVMLGDVVDPITRQHYDRDPRWIAKKAELYLKQYRCRRHGALRGGS